MFEYLLNCVVYSKVQKSMDNNSLEKKHFSCSFSKQEKGLKILCPL